MNDSLVLLDTNIILRSKQPESAHYAEVTANITNLVLAGKDLIVAPQTLYEFYAVATRALSANGLGLSRQEAYEEIAGLREAYTVLPENDRILLHWLDLIQNFEIQGKTTHDARLVAYMQSHQITQFYTLNKGDFERYARTNLIVLV